MSQIGQLVNPRGLNIETLTGDTGGAVGPDGAGNINTFGGTGIVVTGTPGTHTLTWDAHESVALQFDADTGSAVPAANILNVLGSAPLTTTASGNTLTVESDGTIAVTYTTDSGVATPSAGNINVFGATGIQVTGAGDTITIGPDGNLALSYYGNTGIATPALNVIEILGVGTLSVAASGNTLTISQDGTVATTYTCDSGSATPSSGNLNIVGDTGLSTSGSGSTVTVSGHSAGVYEWVNVTGTSDSMEAGKGYMANNAGLVTLTLPSTAAQGTVTRVAGVGAGGWIIDQGSGQSINYLGTSTTVTSGTLAGDEVNACIELLCIVADTTWLALSSTGNFTIT